MDAVTLAEAMGWSVPLSRYESLCAGFNRAMLAADVTTVERAAMWCAQLGHESLGLRYMSEIASGRAYEGRADLGNVFPGDGVRFKGRGPIQVTGRHNYRNLSRWAHFRGYVPSDSFFVDHPERLADDEYGFLGAVWFWATQRPLNSFADARNVLAATRAINGGTTHLEDRVERWNKCLALGERLLPSGVVMESGERFPSLSKYRDSDDPIGTVADFVRWIDARLHEQFVEAEAVKGVDWAIALVKREAAKGDPGAAAVVKQIGE